MFLVMYSPQIRRKAFADYTIPEECSWFDTLEAACNHIAMEVSDYNVSPNDYRILQDYPFNVEIKITPS